MNVLGVLFDSRLLWSLHLNSAIKKANKAKCAIQLLSRYFNKVELTNLLTANYFSILYYNCDIWLIPFLKPQVKQQLLSASANALKVCLKALDRSISFIQLNKLASRATPIQLMEYKHSLLLFKIFNDHHRGKDWVNLNFNQNFSRRSEKFACTNRKNYKVGGNVASNRLTVINNLIPNAWLNLSLDTFKVKTKEFFLK